VVRARLRQLALAALLVSTCTALPLRPASAVPSRGQAALMSLLVPGLGQLRLGDTRMAGVFGGAEVASLTAYITFRREVSLRHDSQVFFAQRHAGADPGPADGNFERDLGTFVSSDEYNRFVVLYNAEVIYQDVTDPVQRVQLVQAYIQKNNYQGPQTWNWDSNDNRITYLNIYKSRLNANKNGNLAFGLLLANHLLSAADAMRPRHAEGEKLGVWDAVPAVTLPFGGATRLTWSLRY
jgi:hypothetical protein